MLVDALLSLPDPDAGGAEMTIRVRGDVSRSYMASHSFGQWRVVGAVAGLAPSVKEGEGSTYEMEWAAEMVEREENWWRVADALREAYEAKARTT